MRNPAMMGTGLGGFRRGFFFFFLGGFSNSAHESEREKIFCIHALVKKIEKHSNGWLKFAYISIHNNYQTKPLLVCFPLLMKIRDTDKFSKDSLNC